MESLGDIAAAFYVEGPAFTAHTCTVRGKRRILTVPNDAMRDLHQKLLMRLRKLPEPTLIRSSYGVHGGRSAVDNALRHLGNRYVYQLDITSAYTSLPFDRLTRVLYKTDSELGGIGEIFAFLSEYCTGFGGGLATGFPASPFLFNLYCEHIIDPVIQNQYPDLTYTRYLDDLIFSSPRPISSSARKGIREVVTRAGFSVNHAKSRLTDRSLRSVTITGVTLTRRGEVRPTNKHLERLHALVTCDLSGMERTHAHVLAGLVGMIEELLQIRPHVRVSDDAVTLRNRAKRRIRQLAKMGTFGERSPVPPPFSPLYLNNLTEHIPVSAVVELFLPDAKPKFVGQEIYILCPIHNEKTPSFSISDEKRFYHCFGCGSHGDIFQFVQVQEKIGFRESVHFLVKHFGDSKRNRTL